MALTAASKVLILLGQCVPCIKQNASNIKIKRLELDINFNMYFPAVEYIHAFDPEKKRKTGDVLIEQLPEQMTRLIAHKVKEVIYPFGDITDPLTGRKCVAGKYREDIELINKVYGELDTRFKYDEAPPRGWQEDKKDFSHVKIYMKYHESGKDQPNAH